MNIENDIGGQNSGVVPIAAAALALQEQATAHADRPQATPINSHVMGPQTAADNPNGNIMRAPGKNT